MGAFKDHFSGHASDYASHRPTYPDELFDFLSRLVHRRSLAWDCATGNGQAAARLANSFERVIATDASADQVASAPGLPEDVEMRVAPAEQSGLASGSVDLVTVAQALHWFDFAAFNREVDRVLAAGGVLAVWSYALTRISPEVDGVIDEFYRGAIDQFWPPERMHVESGYRDIPFPFDEIKVPKFSMEVEWSSDQLLNYLRTWSAVQRYMKTRGEDPVAVIEADLKTAWGTGTHTVSWPLNLRVGFKRGEPISS